MTDIVTNCAAIESYFITKIEAAMKRDGALEGIRTFWKRGRAQAGVRYPLIARTGRNILNEIFTTNRDEATLELSYAIVEQNVDQDVGKAAAEDYGLDLADLFLSATDWPSAVAELDVTSLEDGVADESGSLAVSEVTFSMRFEHLRS